MKKNNLLFLYWGRTGGGARYAMKMAQALKDSNFDFYSSLSLDSDFFEETNNCGIDNFHIKTYKTKLQFLLSSLLLPVTLINLFLFIKKNRITTVYIPMRQHWTFIVLFLFKITKIKTIFTCHDPYLHSGEESKLLNYILKYETTNCDALIVLTNAVRQVILDDFSVPENKIFVIPLASFFDDDTSRINTNDLFSKRKVLFFGRILEYKGIDTFLKACILLQEKGFNISPSIYGNGDLKPYSNLLNKLSNVEVSNTWIDENEIIPIFLKHSLLVLPYKDASQSGPLTIALGLGMPPIVTPVSGLQEQVQHLETGVICETPDALSLSESIEATLSDCSFYENLSQNAFNYAV